MDQELRERAYDRIATRLLALCPLAAQHDVVSYLERRGILEDAKAAGLVALPATSAQRSIVRELLKTFPRDVLDAAGIVHPKYEAFDWPCHRVVIPWRESSGLVTALQRRTLEPREPKYVFPRGGWRPQMPYGAEAFRAAAEGPVILTEGALDTLARRQLARRWNESCQVLGVPAVSILFTPRLWRPFLTGRDVVIAFDSDDAGERAARKFRHEMCEGARTVTRERLQGAKDFGEAVVAAEVTR